jgi:hypothetical protein
VFEPRDGTSRRSPQPVSLQTNSNREALNRV